MDRFVCVYDSTTHAIIGAATSTDTNAYCNRGSSCLTAGTLPNEIDCSIFGLNSTACALAPLRTDAAANTDASTSD